MNRPQPVYDVIPQFDVSDRLRKAREITGLDQTEFAAEVGLGRATISRYERGEVTPSKSALLLYQMRTGVPKEWLATGCTPSDLNREPTDYEFGRTPAIVFDLFGGRAA
jgi:transcriptional regulator with XRE-family HTH domain